MRAIAYCGLACCVCSENKGCVGCQDGGCDIHGWCKNYNCCKEKELNGCWECDEFPCAGGMLDKPRIRAFAEFARRYGVDELEKCLLRNKKKGIAYHYEGQLIGDYDKCQTEEEIIEMIKIGLNYSAKNDIIFHYNTLIDENNDPVHDPTPLQDYMDKWDGQAFIDKMELNKDKSVLEIGVGTGRLAVRVAPLCGEFYGIDISPKTIERAKENLAEFTNVRLICADFLSYEFGRTFHIVYSSLTFMHIEDKQRAVNKIAGLLNDAGRFVLSIDKNPSEFIDTGTRKIKIYPDTADEMAEYIRTAGLTILNQYDTEFASIFVAQKG